MNLRISETVKHLLIINVVMFIGTIIVGDGMLFNRWFSMFFPKNNWFEPWQIITHMFMHGGVTHILFNMFALWMFGTPVEQRLGSKKFLFVYFSAGLGAVMLQVGYSYFQFNNLISPLVEHGYTMKEIVDALNSGGLNKSVVNPIIGPDNLDSLNNIFYGRLVGASGCIMGILAAFGVLYPEAKLMMIFLPIPIKAKYFIPGIILLDLISALSGNSFFSPSNTAYMAHVGGALVGFFIMWYWRKNQFNNNRWDL
ncbi:rhomboid family intramembrane serine protease [Mangrovimonas sp. AS39]|uniref:rhomboid family intramembrane serine protease n=1 Tax=Mangrovimonas futianensis TaxID=2895523 RepID=UPI001E406A7F|nr:rhomboid family intramembrane serine protease [Mangrovimonas futianensis]MCF1192121.1 rhomboid family intramembrane serine protease [Mangrovimonas futianensis]MCF1195815.1 rhomboid family intramembrane serine protease [Mangrovimonas futianensis]